jgi:hypothetical protein
MNVCEAELFRPESEHASAFPHGECFSSPLCKRDSEVPRVVALGRLPFFCFLIHIELVGAAIIL